MKSLEEVSIFGALVENLLANLHTMFMKSKKGGKLDGKTVGECLADFGDQLDDQCLDSRRLQLLLRVYLAANCRLNLNLGPLY